LKFENEWRQFTDIVIDAFAQIEAVEDLYRSGMTPNPPQPTSPQYPITALIPSYIQTFTNQADYQQKTGNAAPAYDITKPIKLWIDTSKVSNTQTIVNYNIVTLDASFQKAIMTTLSVPFYVANTPNIPPDSGPTPSNPNGTASTPVRALLPGEVLVASPFGISVQNTNIQPLPTPAGGLTAQEHAWLSEIFRLVKKNLS